MNEEKKVMMKETEIREVAECQLCHKPFGSAGVPLFWRVRFRRFTIDVNAMKRQDGLTAMLGGHAMLAQVMGPNENMAKLFQEREITICDRCAFDKSVLIGAIGIGEESLEDEQL